MKIGIDGTALAIKFTCGTKHYSEQLIFALANIDKENDYVIFSKQKVSIPKQANFRLKIIPARIPIFKRQLLLPYYAGKEKLDVFHYLEPFGSVFNRHPKIITTVYDIDLGKIFPKILDLKFTVRRLYMEIARKFTFKKTRHFIAISDYTKLQLISYLKRIKVKSPHITTTALAQGTSFKILNNIKKPNKNYFLCMVDFSPRKNIIGIFKAYALLPEKVKIKYGLYIVVSNNAPKEKLLKKAENLDILGHIKLIESLKLGKLVKLYNQPTIFLYPSLYEGFGLPILESMACGCPVITSSRGATKETTGNAGLLVDPTNTKSLVNALEKIIINSRLKNKLISRGLKRVKNYSWARTASETLKVYQLARSLSSSH